MRRRQFDLSKTGSSVLAFSVVLPFVVLAGCAPAPAPSSYYAAHPTTVVVMPSQEPATTTHYVYGTMNSTNETHITSTSTVHIITNHPNDVAPPVMPPAVDQQVAEPPPPEEQKPREEPADETPVDEPSPEPAVEPAPEPPPEEAPPPEPSSDSDNSDK